MIKNIKIMEEIKSFIKDYYQENKNFPKISDIAKAINRADSTTHKYLKYMADTDQLYYDEYTKKYCFNDINKYNITNSNVALVGEVACGTPILAEENITEYISISKSLLGDGNFFALQAKGDSMINAGINDGDLVVIRQQNTAEEGQIVVALIDNEATLKRFYIDNAKQKIRLHPENDSMEDMYFDNIEIQGVVKKVLKDVY